MPRYDFKCEHCGSTDIDRVLRITHTPDEKPMCCGQPMAYHITSVPMVHWTDPNIDAFRPISTPNAPVIHNEREHREYMKRHGLMRADDLGPPPGHEDQKREIAEAQKSIDAVTPTKSQTKDLKDRGLDSILE